MLCVLAGLYKKLILHTCLANERMNEQMKVRILMKLFKRTRYLERCPKHKVVGYEPMYVKTKRMQ